MPFLRKRRVGFRPKRATRKRGPTRGRRTLARRKRTSRLPLPLAMPVQRHGFVKLKYCDNYQLTAATTYSVERVFRLNSLYDPDLTGTGHQPYMHDTLATMWRRYRVHGVKIHVTARNTTAGAADTVAYIRGVQETNTSSTGTVASQLIESGQFIRRKRVPPLITAVGPQDKLAYMSCYLPLRKYASNGTLKDDDYAADFGNNPTSTIYGIIGWAGDAASDNNVDLHVEFTFFCELMNPIKLSQS